MGRFRICLLFVSSWAWSSLAQAAPIDEAKAEFAAGKEAFERGAYEVALGHYEKANSLVPAPSLEYNIGNCHERLGHYQQAASYFEKYLAETGAGTSDDERDFQEKLRARIAADKKRGTDSQPQIQVVPNPNAYTPPPPTYYVPPTPAPPPTGYLLEQAKKRRNNAIALMATGLALTAIGIGFLIDGALNPHGDSCGIFDSTTSSCHDQQVVTSSANIAEDFFGATFFVTGVTLWAPGAASYVNAQKQIVDLQNQDAGAAPKAFLFHSPVIRF
jgi:hypothetical protein